MLLQIKFEGVESITGSDGTDYTAGDQGATSRKDSKLGDDTRSEVNQKRYRT